MNEPFFSICIPTYNRAHLLPAAIKSALAQTDSDFEIIVVDNASRDNTQEILRRYDDPRIRVVRNTQTVSMYANHNICVEHARAPWVVFLHSDDRLLPDGLSRYHDLIENDQSIDIITASCEYYRPLWKKLGMDTHYTLVGSEGLALLFQYLGLNMPGACMKRSMVGELKGFDENTIIADYDLYIRALLTRKRITVLRNGVIELGTTERTTSKLIETKSWVFEQGRVIARHVSDPVVFAAVAPAINKWQPSELSRFLMYVAAGNNKKSLSQFENLAHSAVALSKKERTYSHVRLYKLLGHTGYRFCLKLLVKIQRLKKITTAKR